MNTPRADHYRKEFAKRKESSDLILWMLDEFEQVEREAEELIWALKRTARIIEEQQDKIYIGEVLDLAVQARAILAKVSP